MKPETAEDAAALLKTLGEEGRTVVPRGGGTKPWGPPGEGAVVETDGARRLLEHNVGDFTAILEAGAPLADAQAAFEAEGQMLALDPALDDRATIGGIMATADSGPLRHRYGGVRDLVVGATVALSDGTLAKSGGKVIKNVAGYDLAKLFTGSFGTLGLIVRVAVRLHPLPPRTATAIGASDDPDVLGAAAADLASQPLEADCLDVDWRDGAGRLLVRFGSAAADRAGGGDRGADGGPRARGARRGGGRRRALDGAARPPAGRLRAQGLRPDRRPAGRLPDRRGRRRPRRPRAVLARARPRRTSPGRARRSPRAPARCSTRRPSCASTRGPIPTRARSR